MLDLIHIYIRFRVTLKNSIMRPLYGKIDITNGLHRVCCSMIVTGLLPPCPDIPMNV